MKHLFYHISDTIASHDTTVARLQLQYQLLAESFQIADYQLEFVAVPFGDSHKTAHIVQNMLQEKFAQRYDNITLCINNASRAKHSNSQNAKGSKCLRAKLVYKGRYINCV
ncbi:MAG: hypothetical protein H6765_03580 [Candidatus Peribacteria bacterium]|nr:MAG: hypothetical protein H6765_03580 [Candidatus Peribacteria bacterium]